MLWVAKAGGEVGEVRRRNKHENFFGRIIVQNAYKKGREYSEMFWRGKAGGKCRDGIKLRTLP